MIAIVRDESLNLKPFWAIRTHYTKDQITDKIRF